MAEATGIEWCDSTFNPWIGCSEVGPGCDNCYAKAMMDIRLRRAEWGPGKPRVRTSDSNWKQPAKWNKRAFAECAACHWRGEAKHASAPPGSLISACPKCNRQSHDGGWALKEARRRVFCASVADWLDNEVPIEWFVDLLQLIMETPNLDWLLLTKRIGLFEKRLKAAVEHVVSRRRGDDYDLLTWITQWAAGWPPSNVALLITVVNQPEADRDIIKLLSTPARVRGLSMEPLLAPVDLSRWMHRTSGYDAPDEIYMCPECGASGHGQYFTHPIADTGDYDGGCDCGASDEKLIQVGSIDWVIVGGEDGPRPMHPDWARSLRDQCAEAGVAFMFKQWGTWEIASAENGHHGSVMPEAGEYYTWIAKNGRTWNPSAPDGQNCYAMARVGKKKAGRLLDGREYLEFPRWH